jgi:hypothetical protein
MSITDKPVEISSRIQNTDLEKIQPVFSLRRLAEHFDCYTEDGKPATDTILDWWHSGRIPPPDFRISRKAIFWTPETIRAFIENGGSS